MPFTFVNPGMLLGLFVAAVPLILHLLNRRRLRRVAFSDLRFLDEVQARRSRSFALRRSLLLLLRILILALVALALARPHLRGLAPGIEGGANVLMILDASAGMNAEDEAGRRFARIRERAARLAEGLPAGSAVQAIVAGARPRPVFAGWTEPGPAAARALAALTPADGGCDLAAALAEAARWTGAAGRQPAVVLLLGDGQAPPPGSSLDRDAADLAATGVDGLLVATVGEPYVNGGIRAVETPLRALTVGETFDVAADVLLARSPQPFWLELDGRRVAETVLTGEAGTQSRAVFTVVAPAPGAHFGVVGTERDRLHVDDLRPFVLQVRRRIDVLLVHGADRDGPAGRGGRRYWEEALGGGGGDPLFVLRVVAGAALEDGDLEAADVILLCDPEPLGRRLLESLTAAVRGGSGLLLQVGDPTGVRYLDETLLPALGLAPGATPRRFSAAGAPGARVLRPDHAVFVGFPPDALATLEQSRWRTCLAVADTTLETLVALEDGTPLIQAGALGEGGLCRFNSDLSPEATDIARNPMFPPLARRLAAELARSAGDGFLTVGETPRLRLSSALRARGLSGEPRAQFEAVPADGAAFDARPSARVGWEGREPRLEAASLDRQGFYRFIVGVDTLGVLAAVAPPAESTPADGDPTALVARLAASGLPRTRALPDADAAAFGAALRGADLAPWLLGLAILLLLIETYVSRTRPVAATGRRGT